METEFSKVWTKACLLLFFIFGFTGCFSIASSHATENQNVMKIRVEANGQSTVYELNGSPAAKALYDQLPLNIEVEDFGGNEKIFYPPRKLSTADTPLAANAKSGTLAYYAPWGDVVMFYKNFGSAAGLYELGHATSGEQYIKMMSGTLRIEQEK